VEFRQLWCFVTLADGLHFGRAAAREHIIQSALSQPLRRLERELGVVLFDRTTHRVELTPAGSALLPEARKVLNDAEWAVVIAGRAGCSAPTLHVGVVDAVMTRCLRSYGRFVGGTRSWRFVTPWAWLRRGPRVLAHPDRTHPIRLCAGPSMVMPVPAARHSAMVVRGPDPEVHELTL
jgi:hypothetical protein